jgi:hypothetical protein
VRALGDKKTVVRLYAVDALGMSGAQDLVELLGPMLEIEDDGDVKKHIDYAMFSEGTPGADEVITSLIAWDVETIRSAVVREMAPDFVLGAMIGEPIRLRCAGNDRVPFWGRIQVESASTR